MEETLPGLKPQKSNRALWIASGIVFALCAGALGYGWFWMRRSREGDILFSVGSRTVTRGDLKLRAAAMTVDDPSADPDVDAMAWLIQGLTAASVLDEYGEPISKEDLDVEAKALDKGRGPETTSKLRSAFDGDEKKFQLLYVFPDLALRRLKHRFDTNPECHETERAEARGLARQPWEGSKRWTIAAKKIEGVAGAAFKNPASLFEALGKLKVDEVSDVVDDDSGFYVFKVVERDPALVVEVKTVPVLSFQDFLFSRAQFVQLTFLSREAQKTFETKVPWAKRVRIVEHSTEPR